MTEQFLSITDAARRFGVSTETVRRWERDGGLKLGYRTPTRGGGVRFYAVSEIERILRGETLPVVKQRKAPGR